jgi:hypothetical protein
MKNTTSLDKTCSGFAVLLSGAFAKLREVIIGLIISVRLLGTTPTGQIFMKFSTGIFFLKSSKKI